MCPMGMSNKCKGRGSERECGVTKQWKVLVLLSTELTMGAAGKVARGRDLRSEDDGQPMGEAKPGGLN